MGIELTPVFWSGLLQIILVNILLSGDNALVIALACRNLEKRHQKPAILVGSAGAIILRIVFVLIVDQLLKIVFLKLAGGLLLLWIGIKLVQGEEEEDGDGVKASGSLWGAVRTIVIADAVMSLDNAIAIAAAAHGDATLIVLGLIISIPLIIFGATLIMLLLNRFPIIVIAGGALLGYISGEVVATDPAYAEQLAAAIPHAKTVFEIGGAVITVVVGYWLQRRARARRHAAPVDLAADGKE
ncbi:TerC family protein [Reyranella sp.]|uniref:TerC family protein n=1 Tax=Reyranella sp. TaxID=1929291 RepID=UPI003BAD6005